MAMWNHPGSRRPPAASTWARPMVATVRIRRGAWRKRRMTRRWTATPATVAVTRATRRAGSQPRSRLVMSSTARVAGNAPRSPPAKLTMRSTRYTRAMPTASKAVRPPMMAPCSSVPDGAGQSRRWATRTAAARAVHRAQRVGGGLFVDAYRLAVDDLVEVLAQAVADPAVVESPLGQALGDAGDQTVAAVAE